MAGIFKKNDIRGTFGETLTIQIAQKIGYVFAKILGMEKQVVIAGDSRLSTPALKNAISSGLIQGGCIVNDIGMGPTPMIYFTARTNQEIDAGIMVTASHNPPKDNGIKICDGSGASYQYDNLYSKIEREITNVPSIDRNQSIDRKIIIRNDLYKKYFNFLENQFSFPSKLKIAVEYGNGAAGKFSNILRKFGFDVTSIREHPDGNFPTLLPDPVKDRTYSKLLETFKDNNFDIGLAFDGDGDRIGFITSQGDIISPDKIIMIFAENLINKTGKAKILIDVKISKATFDYITKL